MSAANSKQPDAKVLLDIPVGMLRKGLYVNRLDRPWEGTPFLFQGFELDNDEDLATLRTLCKQVEVLVSAAEATSLRAKLPKMRQQETRPPVLGDQLLELTQNLRTLADRVPERDAVSMKSELSQAAEVLNEAKKTVGNMFDRVRDGGGVDPQEIQSAVEAMVGSVFRNRDAMGWLARMRGTDDYLYGHALATSVWALSFGRHLGLNKETLTLLGTGAMLLDIGKIRIPPKVLRKPGALDPPEWKLMQMHAAYGARLLRAAPGIDPRILAMVESHHERHDGSGYPSGLKGDQIPLIARIAGIVDSYDAMITNRSHARAKSAYDAVRELTALSGKGFQAELVELFVQAVGVFPTGTLVELNTGEVGVVIAQNRFRRLRPEVMVILDGAKKVRSEFVTVDLLTCEANHDAQQPGLWITQALEPGAHGLDPEEYFL